MAITVDDADLLRLAAEPAHDAAPVLDHAAALAPFVIVLALVPTLPAVLHAGLSSESAHWALRALGVHQADRFAEWLQPGVGLTTARIVAQPPLQAWLTAAQIGYWPAGSVAPIFVVSYLSVVVTVLMTYIWACECFGERCAFLSVLVLAAHPQLAQQAASGGPEALTTALLVVTAWGFYGHLQQATATVSWRLLCAGVAWGLAILAGGPVAGAWWLVALGIAGGARSLSTASPAAAATRPDLAPLILLATGLALGGWWTAALITDVGWTGFLDWLVGNAEWRRRGGVRDVGLAIQHWCHLGAWLSGWWLVGLFHSLRLAFQAVRSPREQCLVGMAIWTVVGAGVRLGMGFWTHDFGPSPAWDGFLLVPAALLAGSGLDLVIRRQTSAAWLLIAASVTFGCVLWSLTGRWTIAVVVASVSALLIAASAPLAWGLRRTSLAWNESELRRWIRGLALATLLGHAVWGWWIAPHGASDRQQLERIRRDLASVENLRQTSLVAPEGADIPQLIYLLHALFPHAAESRTTSWDQQLTKTIVAEADNPQSRMLVVEWTLRRELRLRADVGTGWQIVPVVEPQHYRGRRLVAHLIAPAAKH